MPDHNGEKSSSGPARKSYHHGDLRHGLLHAAREEIAVNGAADVSLASLARRAGVAQSAPYRHFADRKALLEAIAVEGFATLIQGLRDAVADCPLSMTAPDALSRAYVRFGEANIELYRLMFASRLVPEAGDGSALDAAAGEAFALFVAATLRPGRLNATVEDERRAYQIWAKFHGLVMLKADGFIESSLVDYVEAAEDNGQ